MKTPLSKKCSAALLGASLVWLLAVGGGSLVMSNYANTPERQSAAPAHWPQASGIARDPQLPTLVMFAHPRCPCTRASLGELALLMAQSQGRAPARVLFFKPAGARDDWAHTDLWASAAAIPGVTAVCDDGGREASRFRAATSGHLLLYDVQGHLLFSGGITSARGHSGDNAGRGAIVALLNHGTTQRSNTPVFGCSILDPHSPCQNTSSPCIQ